MKRNRTILDIRKCKLSIYHSGKSLKEHINEIVWDTAIQIGESEYWSNWAISNIRYNVILGMLCQSIPSTYQWHEETHPKLKYETKKVKVGEQFLPCSVDESNQSTKIRNIGVRKFRSIIPKTKGNAEVYIVQHITSQVHDGKDSKVRPRNHLKEVQQKYDSFMVDELPDGLLPNRSVDHEIEIQ